MQPPIELDDEESNEYYGPIDGLPPVTDYYQPLWDSWRKQANPPVALVQNVIDAIDEAILEDEAMSEIEVHSAVRERVNKINCDMLETEADSTIREHPDRLKSDPALAGQIEEEMRAESPDIDLAALLGLVEMFENNDITADDISDLIEWFDIDRDE